MTSDWESFPGNIFRCASKMAARLRETTSEEKCLCNCCRLALDWFIFVFGIDAESAAGKYQAPVFRKADWLCAWTMLLQVKETQSGEKQVTRSVSNVAMPFCTKSTITCLACYNEAFRLWFHAKCGSRLTRSRNGSMTGPSEFAQASWLTSPNNELASMSVLGIEKFKIASSMNSEDASLAGVIWKPLNCTTSWQNWNWSLLTTILILHNEAGNWRSDRKLLWCWSRREERREWSSLSERYPLLVGRTSECRQLQMQWSLETSWGTWISTILW